MAQQKRDDKASNESAEARTNRGFVRYVNTATERHIRPRDLADIGFSRDEDLVSLSWTAGNQWTVKRSDIPDEVYARAIEPDPDFVFIEPND